MKFRLQRMVGILLFLSSLLGLYACDERALPPKDLSSMTDEDRYEALLQELWGIGSHYDDMSEIADVMNEQQVHFYVLSYYDEEMQNGGLCQFFINAGYMAPYVSESLEALGVLDHKALFDQFLTDTQIDGNSTSAEVSVEAYLELSKKYPFHEFNEDYYALPSLYTVLNDYVRENLAAFE